MAFVLQCFFDNFAQGASIEKGKSSRALTAINHSSGRNGIFRLQPAVPIENVLCSGKEKVKGLFSQQGLLPEAGLSIDKAVKGSFWFSLTPHLPLFLLQ